MVVVFFVTFIWKKRTQKKFADLNLLQKIAPNYSVFKAVLKLAVLCLGLAFLILSLVNPKMGTKLKTLKREGVDIVFALDVSKSMLAEDIASYFKTGQHFSRNLLLVAGRGAYETLVIA